MPWAFPTPQSKGAGLKVWLFPFTQGHKDRQNTRNSLTGYPKVQERDVSVKVVNGEISAATIIRQDEPSGWIIQLLGMNEDPIPLENKRGRSIRLFKTSDAALRWCGRMGFSEATVCLPHKQ